MINSEHYKLLFYSTLSLFLAVRKRECACQLAIRMCEENAIEKLVAFEFTGISNEVEAVLAFKARNADPRLRPCYSKILYTWYIRRGDYRNGLRASFNPLIHFAYFTSSVLDDVSAGSKARRRHYRCYFICLFG